MNAETIREYLEHDHRRLDHLLSCTGSDPSEIERGAFAEFRRGLLKHISMEEKILLPAVQALRHGEPLPIAAQLRLQHGAIAALLVPSPRSAVINALRAVIARHNAIEEGPDGVYAECDRIVGPEQVAVLVRLQAAAEVSVATHVDSEKVEASARRALARAGFDSNLLAD
jgi:hypothetical protein